MIAGLDITFILYIHILTHFDLFLMLTVAFEERAVEAKFKVCICIMTRKGNLIEITISHNNSITC